MIPELRQLYNSTFTPQKYQRFLRRMDALCGCPIQFRLSETPCFVRRALIEDLASIGSQLILQLLENPVYRNAAAEIIPPDYCAPAESGRPLFIQVDFGLVRTGGTLEPRLVEIQAFPTLYAFQTMLAQQYHEVFELPRGLRYLLADLELDNYQALLRRALLGDSNPENVVLLEIDPLNQKTLPDFILTERLAGIRTVCVTEVIQEGRRLFYKDADRVVPIERIYNRVIVDELIRRKLELNFRFNDELDVHWVGHPNWFFKISKFSIPYLRHRCVPQTWFLHQLERIPEELDRYVLKPLFSFAGHGVIIGPTAEQLAAIAEAERSQYILQQRVDFEPVVPTPFGLTKAEIRVMYLWLDQLQAVTTIVRMGRGLMMGVDHNKNMEWVGASAAFYE